jgi:hypothetical protein
MNRFMKAMFSWAAALLVCGVAYAVPPTVNYSDQWWNPNESGWGASIIQQDDLLFVNLLVYRIDNQPVWYTALLLHSAEASSAAAAQVFKGDLYVTTGPWFGSVFNPAGVIARNVGTATFNASSPTAASLSYVVDGTAVAKDLVRLTLRTVNNSGRYLGAISLIAVCGANVIVSRQNTAGIGISQSTDGIQIQTSEVEAPRRCTYTGSYAQKGQVADVEGPYSCDTGETGSFHIYELQSSINGFMGSFEAAWQSVDVQPGAACKGTGTIAGAWSSN